MMRVGADDYGRRSVVNAAYVRHTFMSGPGRGETA